MTAQNIASVCAFILLIAIVQIRAAMMRRRGVRAMVFGMTDKSDFLLVPIVAAIVYTFIAGIFGFPMWEPLIRPFWETTLPGWFGLALCAGAIIVFALALRSFGDSFRVGIDEVNPDKLVTAGIFSVSRNPIYVCFLSFFAGLFLIHRNIAIAVAVVLLTLAIHRQVLREEKFLKSHYGAEYDEYCRKVRRYL